MARMARMVRRIRLGVEVRAHEGRLPWLPWSVLDRRIVRRSQISRFIQRLRPFRSEHPMIRLGSEHDGGYLLPEDLEGIVACFSPGVGEIADFEADVERRGIPAYLLDASVEPPLGHEIRFESRFLGPSDTVSTTTLDAWVKRSIGSAVGDLMLQMDIEGAEWDVLATVPQDLLRSFRIIVIELHGLDHVRHKNELHRRMAVVERLLRDFAVVHIHANNCCRPVEVRGVPIAPVMELTLLRRDRAASLEPLADPRHPLDRPNVPQKRDRPLGPRWGTVGGVRHTSSRTRMATAGGGDDGRG